jgi:hypothetical protein
MPLVNDSDSVCSAKVFSDHTFQLFLRLKHVSGTR